MTKQQTVFVGLSGGVDSSVAALRLKRAGYRVVGVFIKVWQPDFIRCDWEQERLDAMRVAAHLEIPFMTFDAREVYKKEVADYFINAYKEGRTPNPDVACNQYVKFGAFLDFACKHGADAVATGHYAQVRDGELYRGKDREKDQSYFLYTLTREQLAYIRFPVGESTKDVIRREAKRADLPTFEKKDSQGICFLGAIDMKEFLSHYIPDQPGDVSDEEGEIIGTHDGVFFYTLGQRHGFTVTKRKDGDAPWYVTKKDLENNVLSVSHTPPKTSGTITLSDTNWIKEVLKKGTHYQAQIRYRQVPFPVLFESAGRFKIQGETDTPAPGQSCVLYDNDRLVGGGIIESS